mmetsp:Transcript_27581/g.56507  ORF Transcript_27581/g.56507 Transcript_27581/m.56507 type:complete len:405 (+) Transcript_27581:268-1482(+)
MRRGRHHALTLSGASHLRLWSRVGCCGYDLRMPICVRYPNSLSSPPVVFSPRRFLTIARYRSTGCVQLGLARMELAISLATPSLRVLCLRFMPISPLCRMSPAMALIPSSPRLFCLRSTNRAAGCRRRATARRRMASSASSPLFTSSSLPLRSILLIELFVRNESATIPMPPAPMRHMLRPISARTTPSRRIARPIASATPPAAPPWPISFQSSTSLSSDDPGLRSRASNSAVPPAGPTLLVPMSRSRRALFETRASAMHLAPSSHMLFSARFRTRSVVLVLRDSAIRRAPAIPRLHPRTSRRSIERLRRRRDDRASLSASWNAIRTSRVLAVSLFPRVERRDRNWWREQSPFQRRISVSLGSASRSCFSYLRYLQLMIDSPLRLPLFSRCGPKRDGRSCRRRE